MDDLVHRVALVTGASRGIGAESAIALARAGCNVALGYNSSKAEAESVARAVRECGQKAVLIPADVSASAAAEMLVGSTEAELGPVDILVNNAGINPVYAIDELNLERWQTTLQTNLTSSFMLSQRVIPGMRERGWGRLIMMSSVAAQLGGVIGPHYAASKAGQLGLMRSYARLLAGTGITANAIAPALIETDMIADNDNISPDLIPLGRFGAVDEVAELVVHMARNAYITGQTFNVNGGMYMS
ncbi:SDR family NAD(P)-dependent oxidoreductase [Salinisphaera sp. Q1T1-3]|uniref:SDR family NAD(P)-dependent oxidoreductase n=1 Tax=Salinisphaera sp. Q1T1-3 TaxID=2321229 RepID=UPI000E750654|nr:SDR family NAD(P)-dependent oxidoreductase [Salinisphaera sp. Q1T1-3]RJS93062.1 SDR family NAD(P)-dependent oxidoreductase [Salinisphaera sp. Q1T1-3]